MALATRDDAAPAAGDHPDTALEAGLVHAVVRLLVRLTPAADAAARAAAVHALIDLADLLAGGGGSGGGAVRATDRAAALRLAHESGAHAPACTARAVARTTAPLARPGRAGGGGTGGRAGVAPCCMAECPVSRGGE